MANKRRASVREALEAATAGVVTQTPEQVDVKKERTEKPPIEKPATRIRKPSESPSMQEAAKRTGRRGQKQAAADKKPQRKKVATGKGHQKTSTGYLTTAGQEIVRLTLHLTPTQKRKLKIKSLQAGFENASAFIVDALDL